MQNGQNLFTPGEWATAKIFWFTPAVDFHFHRQKRVHLKRVTPASFHLSSFNKPNQTNFFYIYKIHKKCTSLKIQSREACDTAANQTPYPQWVQTFPTCTETSPSSSYNATHKRLGPLVILVTVISATNQWDNIFHERFSVASAVIGADYDDVVGNEVLRMEEVL